MQVTLHTVNQDKRTGGGTVANGTRTTDIDVHVLVQFTRIGGNFQTGYHTLQCLYGICHGARLQFLRGGNTHRTCQVHLLLRTETYNDYFVQHFGVLFQCNVNHLADSGCHFLYFVSYIRYYKDCPRLHRQREVTVYVGNRTIAGIAFLHHAGSDDGTQRVIYCAFHGNFLLLYDIVTLLCPQG